VIAVFGRFKVDIGHPFYLFVMKKVKMKMGKCSKDVRWSISVYFKTQILMEDMLKHLFLILEYLDEIQTYLILVHKISASADGGPRSRVCAPETLCSAPHRHLRKFSGTRVCRVTFKHLPQPLRSHIRSSEP
jgi:hypothetical protein